MRLPPGDRRRLAVGLDDFRPYAGCLAPATAPPAARVSGSLFEGNVASAAGGAVVVRSGALSLADSEVLGNAVTGSAASKLPLGASSIALRELAAAAAEEEEEAAPAGGGAPPSPSLASLFGGIPLLDSSLSSPPAGNPRARGGCVFVGGSCGASGTCTSARAVLSGVKVSGNSAAEAGGGVFYEGTSSPAAALVVSGGEVRGNRAPEASAGGGGVGGGVALVGRGFSLDGVAVSANAARFGGGLFVSADLSLGAAAAQGAGEGSRNATLSSISFGAAAAAAAADVASSSVAGEATVLDGNAGARGRDVFWLRAASPAATLACAGCSFSDAAAAQAAPATAPAPPPAPSTGPVSSSSSSPFKNASSYSSSSSSSLYYSSPALALSPPEGALATEAITAALETSSFSSSSSSPSPSPPSSAFASVQSGSPAPAFAVSLLDFYGQVSTTDGGGSCEVAEEAGPEAGGEARVLLPDAGRRAAVAAGRALFDRFAVTGGVGSEVSLRVGCVPSPAAGKLVLLSQVPKASGGGSGGGGEGGEGAASSSSSSTSLVDVPLSLPALPLRLAVSECGRGTQSPPPESKVPYPVCSPCAFGTYSFDGASPCAPCREGE